MNQPLAGGARPANVIAHPITSREAWLVMRRGDLTASDIGAVSGIDPYRSPLAVWAAKSGLTLEDPETNIMRRGRWLEPAVIAALAEEKPDWKVTPAAVYLCDTSIRLGATPDCLAVDRAAPDALINVQLKVVSKPVFDRDWAEGPPLNYRLQALTEAHLAGAARNFLAALVLTTYSADLHLFEVPRHAAAETKIRLLAQKFWEDVAAGRRPPADYRKDGTLLKQLTATVKEDTLLKLSGDNRLPTILAERTELRETMTVASRRIEEIDTELRDKIGDAAGIELPGWRVTNKQQTRAAYQVPERTLRTLRVTQLDQSDPGEA